MNYLLGIDIGTSGTKTVLIDESGHVVASSTAEYPLFQLQNGWAEQDPKDWWHATVKTMINVITASKVNCKDVKGIGLSGQMHGLVMLDENHEVIRNSIIWCDVRSSKECEEITRLVGAQRLLEITANPALTGFTASKLLWVKNNELGNYKKCRHILLPKDYVRFMLTGEFATDVTDASGMQLLDIKNRCWSNVVLKALDIDKTKLAKLYESPEVTGTITRDVAKLTGLTEGTIVVAGAGDNAAAAVGTGVVSDGNAFTTIGTSGVVYAHTSKMLIDTTGKIHTFCSAVPNEWHVMGVTQAAGLSLKWFKDNFCLMEIKTAEDMGVDPYYILDKQAENSPIGCNNLVYLPYLMGERTPHLDPHARGVFFGLSAIHKKRDMIRAIMEGVSYSLRDCVEVLNDMKITTKKMLVCGGGSSEFWCQMIADVYNCSVNTSVSKEGPALGAAILAGVGAGIYDSVESGCQKAISINTEHVPNSENAETYEQMYCIYKSLYPSLKNCYKNLSNLRVNGESKNV